MRTPLADENVRAPFFMVEAQRAAYLRCVTVLEIIQKSTDYLARKDVDSPRLQSELILAHVLKQPRMKLYLEFQRELSPDVINTCREMVRRRGLHEPLQHLLGTTSFCGKEIRVGPAALIPRPETELLVEHAANLIAKVSIASPCVLDFGTGTGCIAIALADRCPHARIWACEVSAEALALANSNVALHGFEERITFCEGDGFCGLPNGLVFDLLVSNPPYIPAAEIAMLDLEVREHDPRVALDGGKDGLDFYRLLAKEAPERLNKGGRLMVEFGEGQTPAIRSILEAQKWIVDQVLSDYSQRERFLIARLAD